MAKVERRPKKDPAPDSTDTRRVEVVMGKDNSVCIELHYIPDEAPRREYPWGLLLRIEGEEPRWVAWAAEVDRALVRAYDIGLTHTVDL